MNQKPGRSEKSKTLHKNRMILFLLLALATMGVFGYAGIHFRPTNMDTDYSNAAEPSERLRKNGEGLNFDVKGGMYDEPVAVQITATPNYTIYYTLDGTDPQENGIEYIEPIEIGHAGEAEVVTLRAYGLDLEEGYDTELFYQTYFIQTQIEQYGLPVFSIQVSEEEFSSENGIYTTVMDAISAPKQKITAYVQFYDAAGVSQNQEYIQLSMHGSGSLAYPMKSMRMYFSDKAVDVEIAENNANSFLYDPFEGQAVDADGETIASYKHLLLRNGGNDCEGAMLRDSFLARVCDGLSLDTMAGRPVLVYINNAFWGLYNLRERYDAQYFTAHYGVSKENVVLLETPSPLETGVSDAPYVLCEGVDGDEDFFDELVTYCRENDLTVETNYEYVCSQIDIESLIDVVSANLYFANMDWPSNNVKVWRNKNEADASGMDTKWHFLLVDLDYSLGLTGDVTVNLNSALYSETAVGYLMKALLANETFYAQFLDRYTELIEGAFAAEVTVPVLEEMAGEIERAITLNIDRWETPATYEDWESQIAQITEFLTTRGEYAQTYLQELQDNYDWMILGDGIPPQ